MRCIEMKYWIPEQNDEWWLIETWDVLKWSCERVRISGRLINRNMRCIEIRRCTGWSDRESRLIETWDVLK